MAKRRVHLGISREHPHYRQHLALARMTYRDLKAACIMRGMEFEDVVEGDHGILSSWFIKNYDNKKDRELLEDFDLWVDEILSKKYDKGDPFRKFKQFSNLDEDNNISVKTKSLRKADVPKKKPKKREKDKFGLYTGTKKSYTYFLADDLYKKLGTKNTVKELCKKYSGKLFSRVKKKHPEAVEKSVKMWMKRALDELEKKKG